MVNTTRKILTNAIREIAHPLTDRHSDYEPLLDMIGDARFVLLGEASHGTHEFYDTRAIITQRLITEKGFTAVAVEADWPDAYRVNRYVQGISGDTTAQEALDSFQRFPLWMWRNQDVLLFLEWLRTYNSHLNEGEDKKVGFYGLDLYSLYHSIEAVINYLEAVDPEAAKRARYRYGCFEHTGEDAQDYGYAANFQLTSSCEQDVINQLVELQQHTIDYARRDGQNAEDEFFYAEQNARVVKNAEEYYRSMFGGRISSWNLRDQHMTSTLDALMTYLTQQDEDAKIVVWEHNSHLGDARATSMGDEGELNVGQLVRERYPNEAILVGFSTYSGTVTAASAWDGQHERKRVRPALPESYEALFHETALPRFFLSLRNDNQTIQALRNRHLERAIGVIYLPHSERVSHYFYARLPEQFDGIIHIDETHAVEPLDRSERWEAGDLPETAPTAL
jgi:erythromycin esterase-like protein